MTSTAIQRVGQDFLDFTHAWHEARKFAPFAELAPLEQISVTVARDVEDGFALGKRRITLNQDQGARRMRYTKMHELGHYLFKTAEDGRFIAELRSRFSGNLDAQRKYEELIVIPAGLQLFIPRPMLREVFGKYEEDARRAQWLAMKTGGSFAVAGQRIAAAVNRPVAGLIMGTDGRVSDYFGNDIKKLNSGRNFTVPEDHPLRQKSFEAGKVEFLNARVPFKHSHKKVSRHMQLLYDDLRGQVIVFFNAPYGKNNRQRFLFPEMLLS